MTRTSTWSTGLGSTPIIQGPHRRPVDGHLNMRLSARVLSRDANVQCVFADGACPSGQPFRALVVEKIHLVPYVSPAFVSTGSARASVAHPRLAAVMCVHFLPSRRSASLSVSLPSCRRRVHVEH